MSGPGPKGHCENGGYSRGTEPPAPTPDLRELYIPRCSFSPQKGSWALAQTESPPKFSALEMLENSLYSPTWEGKCLA